MSYQEEIRLMCSQEDSGEDCSDEDLNENLLKTLDDRKERFENEFTCIEADSNTKILYTAKDKDSYDLMMVGNKNFDNFYKFINKSGDECTLFTNNKDNIWSPSKLDDSSFTIYLPKHAIRLSSFAFRTPKDESLAGYMPNTICLFGYNDDFSRWDVLYFARVQTLKTGSRYDLNIENGTQKNFYRAFSFFTYSDHFALSFFKLYGDLITQEDGVDMSVFEKIPRIRYHNMPVIEGHENGEAIFDSALKIFGPRLENFVVALYEKGDGNEKVADLWGVELSKHFKSKVLSQSRPNIISFFFPNHIIYLEGYKIYAHESPNVRNWCICINTDINSEGIIVHERRNATLKGKKFYNYEINDINKSQRFCRIIRFIGLDKEFSFKRIDFFGIAIPVGHKVIDLSSLYTCPYPSKVDKYYAKETPKVEDKKQKNEEIKKKEVEKVKPKPVRKPSPPSSSISSSDDNDDDDDDDDDYIPTKKQPQRSPSKTSNQPQKPPSSASVKAKNSKPEPPKEPTSYYCRYCGYKANSISTLTFLPCNKSPSGKHVLFEGDTNGPFYCMYCGYKANSISTLTGLPCNKSPNGKHSPFESSGLPVFYCKYCGYKANSISTLTGLSCNKSRTKKHVPFNGPLRKNYYCRYCGYKASSISTLTGLSCNKSPNGKHVPYSGDEKRYYYCKCCGYKAGSISTLTGLSCNKSPNGKHVPYSGDEKRYYYCKCCGYKASSISTLTNRPCNKNPNGKHIPAK